jgi:hypothetical protein
MAATDVRSHHGKVGSSVAQDFVVIVENLPADLPVREAEIAVLETYLGDIVDRILAGIEHRNVSGQKDRGTKD